MFEYETLDIGWAHWELRVFCQDVESKQGNAMKSLVIPLQSDGFFDVDTGDAVNEFVAEMKKAGQKNNRHKKTLSCYGGWVLGGD
jgi:hypothetical protein